MSTFEQLSRAWGLVRSHSPAWIGARLILEAQKRSGQEARAYPARAWRPDEWRGWVGGDLAEASPEIVLGAWRGSAGSAWGRRRTEPDWRAAYAATLGVDGRASLVAAAEAILAGQFTLFSCHVVAAGFPPRWQENPLSPRGVAAPRDVHWSHVSMSDPASFGDLKLVWELSRGAWAFTLARAYAATLDERFAEGFWRLWESWIDDNPPHSTVQWKCGQECSLRLIAVTFAVEVLTDAKATTPERFVRHLGAAAALADRVHKGGWYAQLQDNNHSMSEGAGTYTVGVAYPMLREAGVWREAGWQRLCREAERLVRPDGTFRQKSHNYHRLMLHVYLWAASLAAKSGERFPSAVRARLGAAVEYLEAIVDRDSGEVPNFGANDGALILPLAEAAYVDYRPTLAAARAFVRGRVGAGELSSPATSRGGSKGPSQGPFLSSRAAGRATADGPAAEMPLWLFGGEEEPPRLDSTVGGDVVAVGDATGAKVVSPSDVAGGAASMVARSFLDGGIHTLHQTRSWLFAHAEHFRDRPGQADQLHVDLWWRGLNLARDAGTYMYYGPPRLHAWFRGSSCHNTITVDGRDQMEPGPRFLWASRAQARARIDSDASGKPASLWMTHDGYERLGPPVKHERRVTALGDDAWLVTDDVRGRQARRYRLHWLLPDYPIRSEGDAVWTLETPRGPYYVQVVVAGKPATTVYVRRAVEDPEWPWGWQSRHYAERTPACSLVAETVGANEHFVTLFSPRRPQGAIPHDPFIGAAT